MAREGPVRLKADAIEGFGSSADTLGFFGATPVARPAAYTVTNASTDRALNVSADTTAQVAAVLGTLIADLQSLGLLQ